MARRLRACAKQTEMITLEFGRGTLSCALKLQDAHAPFRVTSNGGRCKVESPPPITVIAGCSLFRLGSRVPVLAALASLECAQFLSFHLWPYLASPFPRRRCAARRRAMSYTTQCCPPRRPHRHCMLAMDRSIQGYKDTRIRKDTRMQGCNDSRDSNGSPGTL